jgi:hypothetical protein
VQKKHKENQNTISFHGTPPEKKIYCEARFKRLTAAKRSHWWNAVTDFWLAQGAPELVFGEEFDAPPAIVVERAKANWRHYLTGPNTSESVLARLLAQRARDQAKNSRQTSRAEDK